MPKAGGEKHIQEGKTNLGQAVGTDARTQQIAWIRTNHRDKWFSGVASAGWRYCEAQLECLLRRWSGSTGCGIAVGSCWKETRGKAGTLPLMACPTKAPHAESVGSGERCLPATGLTSRSSKPSPKATKAMPSTLPSTACWLSSPWTCSSSSTGQIFTCASSAKQN